MNLLRHNVSMMHSMLGLRPFALRYHCPRPAQFNLMSQFNAAPFSKFFEELDEKSVNAMHEKFSQVPEYEWRQAEWKDAIAKKARRREAKRLRDEAKEPIKEQDAIVYIHNAEEGVVLPTPPDKMFAVVRMKGRQHKVVKDDKILVEQTPFEVGDQICLDDVLLVGTTDYTAIGRPTIENARVYATVEEYSPTEKVIVFKKKRRKGYQRSASHRQQINVLRVDRIEHDIEPHEFAEQGNPNLAIMEHTQPLNIR